MFLPRNAPAVVAYETVGRKFGFGKVRSSRLCRVVCWRNNALSLRSLLSCCARLSVGLWIRSPIFARCIRGALRSRRNGRTITLARRARRSTLCRRTIDRHHLHQLHQLRIRNRITLLH